ncbi:MAG: hypothetical protein RR182_08560 [Alistipes sp.]
MKLITLLLLFLPICFHVLRGRVNATFGTLPNQICKFIKQQDSQGHLLSAEQVDGLHEQLTPLFAEIYERDIPFEISPNVSDYEVTHCRIQSLCSSCDVTALVQWRSCGQGDPVSRLFYKSVDATGKAISRGLVLSEQTEEAVASGTTTFHLVVEATEYRRFAKIVFLTQAEFSAVTAEVRGEEK